jgi:soluble lytic murein transglycosylase-like protein
MAATDERRVARYQEDFRDAGARHGIDPAFLAAIASRESRGGNVLDANGCGDGGNGFGLMQVDRRYHQTQGGPFSREHINQAAGILAGFRDDLAARHPDWTRDQVMTASLSAYNRGTRNMDDPGNTDRGTTGGDYANDVIARAQYYKERGF